MSQLNINQRRQIIDAALSELSENALAFEPGSGMTMRQEIRNVIEETLDDDCGPDTVARLLLKMVDRTIAELGNLGFDVRNFDFRDHLTSGGGT